MSKDDDFARLDRQTENGRLHAAPAFVGLEEIRGTAGDSEVRGLATFLEEVDPGTKVK